MVAIPPDLVMLVTLMDAAKSYLTDTFGAGFMSEWTGRIPPLNDLIELYESDMPTQIHAVLDQVGLLAIREGGADSAQALLLMAGIIIFFGVAGETFFRKTGIPDVVFLLVLGTIAGPVLGIVEYETVVALVPYFAAIALIIIMFDGGLNLDLKHLQRIGPLAITLAIAGFVVSVAIVATLAHYVIGWDWFSGILLGSIVGGSSSIIVFGLVRNIGISERARNMLAFESAITDVLATVVAFVMFGVVVSGMFDEGAVLLSIGYSLGVGLALGLGVGIPWMIITARIARTKHAYMLTLGLLFVLYFLANHLGESGALTALVFGLMVGNRRRLIRIFRIKMPHIEIDDAMHNQLTFLIRVFFFVFIGLLASFGEIELVIFGILATVGIYVGRIPLSRLIIRGRFSSMDRRVTEVMIPRGLAAAVLASLPLTLGLPHGETYPQIVFFVILSSVIITTLGLTRQRRSPSAGSPSKTPAGRARKPAGNQA